MITFEIEGVEYTARITDTPPTGFEQALHFTGPDGAVYWIHQPMWTRPEEETVMPDAWRR